MAGALFARVKTWIAEILYYADLNAEIQNILDKFMPQWMDDYSATISQMQTATSPGSVGSESQATSLAGELERIRYVIKRIIDSTLATHWYEVPDTDLRVLAGGVPTLAIYMNFESETGIADATSIFRDVVTRGVIANAISFSALDFSSSHITTTAAKVAQGKGAYVVGSGFLAVPGQRVNPYNLSLSAQFRNLVSNDYIAFNPLTGHELFFGATGLLTARVTERTTTDESTKASSSITGSVSRVGDTTYRTAIMKFRGNDIEGSSTDLLELEYEDAEEGTQLTAQDLDINGGDGGNWFFGCKPNNPTWDHISSMHVLPESHSSPWTKTGAGFSSVSGGILSISTTASQVSYNRATLVDLSQQTLEWKMRITAFQTANSADAIQVYVRDDSMNRATVIAFQPNGVQFGASDGSDANLDEPMTFAPCNTAEWHVYRFTSSGGTSPVSNLYIDGVLAASFTNSLANATATDLLSFGGNFYSATTTFTVEMEYFKVFDAGATVPVAVNTASDGQLDDIAIVNGQVDSGLATKLQTLAADVVYSQKFVGQFYLPPTIYGTSPAGSSTDGEVPVTGYMVGDGRTLIKIDSQLNFLASATGDLTFWLQFSSADAGIRQSLYDIVTNVAAGDFNKSRLTQVTVAPAGLYKVEHVLTSAAGGNIDVSNMGGQAYGMSFTRA